MIRKIEKEGNPVYRDMYCNDYPEKVCGYCGKRLDPKKICRKADDLHWCGICDPRISLRGRNKMLHYNRFDIVEAHYWWLADHHEGQRSDSYSKLSRLSEYFRPGPLTRGPATENARAIYDQLCEREGAK